MNWWHDFADRIECDASVGRLTWYRVGGRARYLFRPKTVEQLSALLRRARDQAVPVRVLGAGANVLVKDGCFDGVVVKLDDPAFKTVCREGHVFRVGAGRDLIPFCRFAAVNGFSGLEGMAGIPGTVGGAVRTNAGGRFGEFGSVVRCVDVMNEGGEVSVWTNEQIRFAYRSTGLRGAVVLSATLELQPDDPAGVLERFNEYFRYKTQTQPLSEKSAGCVFKNPGERSAGALIDEAGLKGARQGGAEVSRRHANFIVARAGARASDILGLIELVRDRVARLFRTELEMEIDVW